MAARAPSRGIARRGILFRWLGCVGLGGCVSRSGGGVRGEGGGRVGMMTFLSFLLFVLLLLFENSPRFKLAV